MSKVDHKHYYFQHTIRSETFQHAKRGSESNNSEVVKVVRLTLDVIRRVNDVTVTITRELDGDWQLELHCHVITAPALS